MVNAGVSKEKGIELIVSELKIGTKKEDIMANFGKNWQTPKDTFNKWYLIAKEKHTEANKAKELQRQELLSESLKDEIQAQILTELDIDLILSQIAKGEVENTSPSDVIAACRELYKRKGSYKPTKISNTTVTGEDVNQLTISMPLGLTLQFPSNTDEAST